MNINFVRDVVVDADAPVADGDEDAFVRTAVKNLHGLPAATPEIRQAVFFTLVELRLDDDTFDALAKFSEFFDGRCTHFLRLPLSGLRIKTAREATLRGAVRRAY